MNTMYSPTNSPLPDGSSPVKNTVWLISLRDVELKPLIALIYQIKALLRQIESAAICHFTQSIMVFGLQQGFARE